jgi:hypothetical protein
MTIYVNGAPLAMDQRAGGNLGEALSAADGLIEKAGSVIVSLRVDGAEVDADSYAAFASRPMESIESVEIQAEDSSAIRIRAIRTFLELLALAKRFTEDEPADGDAVDWPSLRAGALDMRDAFAGLFSADELSFVQLFAGLLERAGDAPDKASRVELSAQADRLSSVFGERLAELVSPALEMRTAASLFEAKASELADLPVLLQTGKEDQAMKVVLYFIEIFNKVIRVIPELRKSGIDTSSISIGGSAMAEFYGSFNEVLRDLTGAFERKDSVLIGDLAEYEVLPRMRDFFSAMRDALPES